MKGTVKRKTFSPPPGASAEHWCYLLVETNNGDNLRLRLNRRQVNRIMVGDDIRFRRPLRANWSIRVRLVDRTANK